MRVRLRCPAKINTFLAVGPPDATGYHPLRSIFRTVSLYDVLEVERSEMDSFSSPGIDLPEDNTVTRALRLAREYVPVPPLAITLHKQIPSESGLGGGSSDAAGMIRAIDTFAPTRLELRDRLDIARAVGADVAFFLFGGTARVSGYGERVDTLPDEPVRWLVLAKPPIGCPTREMYRALDAIERPFREWPTDPWALHNDFASVAPPECRALIDALEAQGLSAGLTGSGAAVFGLATSIAEADEVRARLDPEVAETWTVRTLGRDEPVT